jgi:3'-5' exonuclease
MCVGRDRDKEPSCFSVEGDLFGEVTCQYNSAKFLSLWLYHRIHEVRYEEKADRPLAGYDFLNNERNADTGVLVEEFLLNRPSLFISSGPNYYLQFQRKQVLQKPRPKRVNPTLVVTAEECVDAITKLNKMSRFGFDTEHSLDKNKLNVVRVVQLCGPDLHPYVFWIDPLQPNLLFDSGLRDFLSNPKPKFSVGGAGDCAILQARHGIVVGGVEECQAIASAIVRDVLGAEVNKMCMPSLKLLVAICGVPRSTVTKDLGKLAGGVKKISYMFNKRLENNPELLEYAGFDAVACIQIYQQLEQIHISKESLGLMIALWHTIRNARLQTELAKQP